MFDLMRYVQSNGEHVSYCTMLIADKEVSIIGKLMSSLISENVGLVDKQYSFKYHMICAMFLHLER